MVAITGRDRQAVAVSETTALLGSSKINYADVPAPGTLYSSSGSGDDNNDKEKPLPKFQILLLCYARAVEPLAFFSIFPYVSQMVKDNGNVPDSDIGFYSGLIESMFSLTQAAVMIFWGQAADRFGRKPVLVLSLFGVAVATGLFGLAKTIPQMIAFRCLAGVFAGTIVTIRTMVSEHSTPSTQARAFSWFAFSGNLGLFLGPLLGGALADPVRQYPGIFGAGGFFEKYPYALSSFVVALIGGTAAMSSACFIKETLKEPAVVDREAASNAPIQSGDLSTKQLLKSPGVGMVLYTYGYLMVLAFAYTAIIPVFWFTPVDLGGYAFTPLQISLMMGLNGAAQAAWLLLVFPPLQKRIGSNGVIRLCASLYPFFFLSCPLGNVLLRMGTEASVKAFWIILPFTLVVGCGVSMSFTAIQLLLNDVSPSPQVLGTLNALAMTGICGLRAFNPALFTTLFALGARTQLAGGHAIWILMFLLASGLSITTKYLPESNTAVKRQNSQAR
ncbi:Tetracycline resistance protein, TetA/multidrug resistance protein MdtG [Penicillium expansum]|uniref:Tetracycline resistance protein, TetA/multidrug resistance protein MdtG n=1 Tax=Penicillium expansum TaxID=27334 RepID=A0A0A2JVT4_PENEN|nr:Tetracycline resistance protein, TetA/multidrug resistance protein MdtG [Penicillium expansum]KGO40795.1 Tetracycline resistance protein, TetA/multidrug resistance protein MdtG [Penicillium expansum]KGO48450.1 Tetracycline resistance protein, TetA/multidrug resistance protein MdtG [Penicillium expansum]KGO59567.1 Tetracycline resistance protein, TetA/multidrug resistance protein MdtG [Penicillium expansum]